MLLEYKILFQLVFIFWYFHIIRRFFYYLYLWQLKEYRFDRYMAKIKDGFKLSAFLIVAFYWLLLIYILLLNFNFRNIFYLYLALAFYSLYKLFSKQWRFPRPTFKILALGGIVFLSLTLFTFIFWSHFFIFALTLELIFPIYVYLGVLIVHVPTLLIKNNLKKKARNKIISLPNLTVIAITGSYGKSSTKEFLYTILSEKYKVIKAPGNINTPIGITNFIISEVNESHQFFICEIGAYKKGEIKEICDFINPKVGILTGINQQHLGLFGSQEDIIKGKFELIESLSGQGTAILNYDNTHIKEKIKKSNFKVGNIVFYSVREKADFWINNLKIEKDFSSFTAFSKKGGSADFKVNLPGPDNSLNFLGALAAASTIGMSFAEILRGCNKINSNQGLIKLKTGFNGLNIIDSTYSSNPDSVSSHLEYLKIWPGKKIIIMPCIIELGNDSKKIHKEIGGQIAKVCDLAIITTKIKFKELKEGFLASNGKEEGILYESNPDKIFDKINNLAQENGTILLESRVPKKLINLLSGNEKLS